MRARTGLALTAALLGGLPPLAAQSPERQTPTFRTGVELVAVDVSVIDRDGRPVRDLSADDFTVTVDGRPRRLVSAAFVPLGTASRPAAVVDRPSHYSTNAGAAGGRLIVFVVDRGNIRHGEGRPLLAAASRFIERLDPADRVALAVIPDAGSYVDFTAKHALVGKTLESLLGSATPVLGSHTIGLAEALAIERQDFRTLERVVGRECIIAVQTAPLQGRTASSSGALSPAAEALKECEGEVRSEARLVYGMSRQQAAASLAALRDLLARLTLVSGPKTVVLLSEGLFVDVRERGELEQVGVAAAASNTTLYAVGLDTQHADASSVVISPTFDDDRVLRREGLELLVRMTRGRMFPVAAGARTVFDRIGRELSGYYLLSFEPEADDRRGAIRTIDVDVRRPGVEVRARRHFLIDRGSSSRPTSDVLAEILRTPLPATDLLLRLATFVYPGDGPQLRVVLAAEIEGATGGATVPCGFSLTDASGQVVGATLEGPSAAAQPRGDGHQYLASLVLAPGRYTLKLAAVDDLGRRGSVEHDFEARLTPAGQVRVGDLMLADAPRGRSRDVRPSIATRMTSDELIGYVEIASDVPSLLETAQVSLEVAASETGPALGRSETRLETATVGRRVAEGRLPTDALPPGDYVARAIVSSGRRPVAQVTRPFRVERSLGAPASAAVAKGTARLVPSRLRGPAALAGVERFGVERVLRPEVVGYFLDRMPRDRARPFAEPVARAADEARVGRFDDAEATLTGAGADDVMAVFLRGLARLARGELDSAASEFRRTLRLSSDFFPGTFYLGACHAAGGRDEEAAGAWQTSIITDPEAPFVYELLGDALLRLEEGTQAVDILGEARELWPGNAGVLRRLAIAHAQAGQHAEAIETLERYLQNQPDDRDAWLLGAWVVYDARLSGHPLGNGADDLARLDRYRDRYVALGGPQAALVDQWRKSAGDRAKP